MHMKDLPQYTGPSGSPFPPLWHEDCRVEAYHSDCSHPTAFVDSFAHHLHTLRPDLYMRLTALAEESTADDRFEHDFVVKTFMRAATRWHNKRGGVNGD